MMYFNEEYPSDILPLMAHGTNSTMFTACCSVALCDDEKNCPKCKRPVIGAKAETSHERHKIRWQNATRFWKKGK